MVKLDKQVIYDEIRREFGDDPYCEQIAKGFFDAGNEYITRLPIGWNVSDDAKTLKRMKKDHEKKIKAYMKEHYLPPPKGFVMGILLWPLISGVISWVVGRILGYYFPDFWKK